MKKNLPSSWTSKISIVKMFILSKMTYQFNAIFIKLSIIFFTELEKKTSKIVWNIKTQHLTKN